MKLTSSTVTRLVSSSTITPGQARLGTRAAGPRSEATRAKRLSKMLRIVENERFTFEIDSENVILDCTLER